MKLDILKKRVNFIVFILFITFTSNAQKINYKFSYLVLNKEYNEWFTKKIINDSIYVEKEMFDIISKNLKFIKYPSTKTIYILDRNEKKLFFNNSTTDIILDYNNRSIILNWEKSLLRTYNNYTIYRLKISPQDVFITHQSIYYFTFENGVIAIEGNDFLLKREDFNFDSAWW